MPSGKKDKSLKNKYKSLFSEEIPEPVPELESSVEKIYPTLSELFTGNLEEVEPSHRNMDANSIQRMNEDREKAAQRVLELEGSVGQTLHSMQRIEARILACEASLKKEIPSVAPIILMEDNLTKAKRAIMVTKVLCPTGEAMQAMLSQTSRTMQDVERIAKGRETIIKKTIEYVNTFPKYNGESRKGQKWCAQICFHAQQYNVEAIEANDVKFAIYGAVDGNMKNRILHLEPGTLGYKNFTASEYLEEM